MVTTLATPKGISSTSVIDVPNTWNAEWFRRFIRTQLSQADVRNASPGTGIAISANPTTNATISIGSNVQALFNQPYVLATGGSTVLDAFRVLAAQSGVLSVTDGGAEGNITIGVVANGIGNGQIRQGAGTSVVGNSGTALANVADIAATADNTALIRQAGALAFAAVPLAALASEANNTVVGNVSGSPAPPVALTRLQLTALVNSFTATLSGAVPASAGGTVNFLRADGSFVQVDLTTNVTGNLPLSHVATIANNTVLGNVAGATATPAALSATQLTALVNAFSASLSGAAPASGGGTSNFLRADGNWAAPAYPTAANPSASVGLSAVNGTAATFMRSDAAPQLSLAITPTWTAFHTFSAGLGSTLSDANSGLSGAPIYSSAVTPAYYWNETGAAANARAWCMAVNGGALRGRIIDDSGGTAKNWLEVDRSGAAVSSIFFGNAADNPSFTFLGTGSLTANGSLKVVGNSGFNNTAPISKPTVTGSRGGNAALASFLTALANYGLITDSTTA